MPIVNPHTYGTTGATSQRQDSAGRARIIYGVLLAVCAVFIIRLFYLQVIRHDYYRQVAQDYQLKEYQIPAERGVIFAYNGSNKTPLVLNEIKYTLFADPVYVTEPEKQAVKLAEITGGNAGDIAAQLQSEDTRYVVIEKRLSKEQHDKVVELDAAGIGTREETYRTYPQGPLAAQVLGFVNDEGDGQYGVEQALDSSLRGKAGELKAITDARGVPLVSNDDNVVTEPVPGQGVTLTVDIGLQRQVEDILKAGIERAKSPSGSVVVMDPRNGEIKAMANFPSYDPSKLSEVEDIGVLTNPAATQALEVGSVMKTLTVATAIDQGVVSSSSAYYSDGFVVVGDRTIRDVLNSRGTQNMESILSKSLNTGAVWLLKQIGRGDINERARLTWYDYMTKHFFLGQATGIEQAGEATGYIPPPEENGQGINVTYANTSFGQGMTATTLQMAAALSSVVNGGTYYQPRLVDSVRSEDGKDIPKDPIIKKSDVVSDSTSEQVMSLMEAVIRERSISVSRDGYRIGGKTGTAEFVNPETGLYYSDRYHGTYVGFVGGDTPEYVIAVLVNEPKISGFAGTVAAEPIFRDVTTMLLDNFGVTPMGQQAYN